GAREASDMSDFIAGDRVLAQWNGGALWFPGTVHSLNGTTVAIQYDDGMGDIRPENQVKPLDWREGSKIEAVWSGDGKWYAGTIARISADERTIDILYEDGTREVRPSALCRSR